MGNFLDIPKSIAMATSSKEPVHLHQLAEAEENILKALDELAQKLSAKNAETAKK